MDHLWCLYHLFWLSFWRHPFTAEDPLVSKWCKAKFLRISSNEEASTSWMLVLSTFGKQTKPGRTLDLQHIVMVTCPHQCALTGVTLFGVKQDPNCYRSRVEGPDCQEGKESKDWIMPEGFYSSYQYWQLSKESREGEPDILSLCRNLSS